MKLNRSICLTSALLFLAVTGCKQSGTDPTGTWRVTVSSANAQTLKLKFDGGALTGALTYNSSPTVNGKASVSELPITDAKLQGNELSFNFTHPPASGNGPSANYSYQGNINGDSIEGTVTGEWMGHTFTNNWEAKRVNE